MALNHATEDADRISQDGPQIVEMKKGEPISDEREPLMKGKEVVWSRIRVLKKVWHQFGKYTYL